MKGETAGDPLDDTGHHPLYQKFECRRAHPRVKLRLPVQIGLSGGSVVCARIYNISPDGVQVRCDRATAARINPGGRAVTEGNGQELLLAVRLHHDGHMRSHVLRCRLSYMLPETEDDIIIGLNFQDLLPEQRAALDSVVGASLEPASV
jgi:hypothetical protein